MPLVVIDDVDGLGWRSLGSEKGSQPQHEVEEPLVVDGALSLYGIRLESDFLPAIGRPPRTVVRAPCLRRDQETLPSLGVLGPARIGTPLFHPLVEAVILAQAVAETVQGRHGCVSVQRPDLAAMARVIAMPIASNRYQLVVGAPDTGPNATGGSCVSFTSNTTAS